MMRTYTGLLVALTLGLASAATAATVTVDTDKKTYAPGESIVVTTTLTIQGGEAAANQALLILLWNDAQILGAPGPTSQPTALTSGGGFFSWSVGAGLCLSASCVVIDQLSPIQPAGSIPDIAVVTTTLGMIADSPGTIDFAFGAAVLFGATPISGGNMATAEVIAPCDATIQINALRGGSPNVGVPGTKNITSKARLEKGTGPADQTLDNTSLIIEAFDGAVLIDSQMSPDLLTLIMGKGGRGDRLTMTINQCDSGFIDFFATFTGTSSTNGSTCSETSRFLRKTCN